MIIRRADANRLVIFGTMMVAPETMAKLPKEIDSSGLVIIGGMGFKVDLAGLGPREWVGYTHGSILCRPLNIGELKIIDDPITNKIACLDNLQFCDMGDMFEAIKGL